MVYTTEDPSHAVVKCAAESSLQLYKAGGPGLD